MIIMHTHVYTVSQFHAQFPPRYTLTSVIVSDGCMCAALTVHQLAAQGEVVLLQQELQDGKFTGSKQLLQRGGGMAISPVFSSIVICFLVHTMLANTALTKIPDNKSVCIC